MHNIVMIRTNVCLKTTAFATYETLSWEFFNIFGFYADAVVFWSGQVVHGPEVGIMFVIGTDYTWKKIVSFLFSFFYDLPHSSQAVQTEISLESIVL